LLLSQNTFQFLSTSGDTSLITHALPIAIIPVQVLYGNMKITFQTT
jgi:hypothetical protein